MGSYASYIFMSSWLFNCPSHFKPLYYKKIVDISLIFKPPTHVRKFLSYLNSQHPNMKFIAFEKKEKLPYLTYPSITLATVLTFQCTEKIHLLICVQSYLHSPHFHINAIQSTRSPIELTTFAQIGHTQLRNFHSSITSSTIIASPNNLLINISAKLNNVINYEYTNIMVPQKIALFPCHLHRFTQPTSQHNVSKLISEYCPHIKLSYVQNKIGCPKFLDTIPLQLRSNILYKYTCDSYNASYIGNTTKHLKAQISQHTSISDGTGIQVTKLPFSAIGNHADDTDHPIHSQKNSVLAIPPPAHHGKHTYIHP